MTYTATWSADEAGARRLSDALAEADVLAADMTEAGDGRWTVTAYYAAPPDPADLAAFARAALGEQATEGVLSELPDEDWVSKSLQALAPIRAGRFIVHGSHDRGKPLGNETAIEIDAGQAFGTGHHGTTAGCLQALEDLAKARTFEAALDLGTGSGVLAIAAAKTWRIPVLATDIDPLAVRIAKDNVRLNGVAGLVRVIEAAGFAHLLLRPPAGFDLIVANILANPLAAMAGALTRALLPDGIAVLSGLLPAQRQRVLAAYRARGLVLRRSFVRNGWLTLVLGR
jgi:ribosomal protein L11 methyltransferase